MKNYPTCFDAYEVYVFQWQVHVFQAETVAYHHSWLVQTWLCHLLIGA